jgi:hypothetical protein
MSHLKVTVTHAGGKTEIRVGSESTITVEQGLGAPAGHAKQVFTAAELSSLKVDGWTAEDERKAEEVAKAAQAAATVVFPS